MFLVDLAVLALVLGLDSTQNCRQIHENESYDTILYWIFGIALYLLGKMYNFVPVGSSSSTVWM